MADRHIITSLSLKEISAVDNPAQAGARATIMKRRASSVTTAIAKALVEDGKVKSFDEVFADQVADQERWRIQDKMYPLYDALRTSISSVIAEATGTNASRVAAIESNVEAFLAAVRAELPEIEEAVAKALLAPTTGDDTMTKTVEQLTADLAKRDEENATLKSSVAELAMLASLSDAERGLVAKMSAEDKKKLKEMDEKDRKAHLKKSLDADETIDVPGVGTVTKSAVGETSFAVFKSMAAQHAATEERVAKAEDAALTATVTKRANEEFQNLPGTLDEKVTALKALSKLDETVRAPLEAMLKAANDRNANAFKSLGTGKGGASGGEAGTTTDVAKAASTLDAKAAELRKSHSLGRAEAYERAVRENPDLVAAMNAQ